MISKKYRDDFLNVQTPSDYVAFKEKYKNKHYKFDEFDIEMKRHFNTLIMEKPQNEFVHTEVHKKN